LTITEAREKISTYLESSEFLKIIDVCLAKLKKTLIFYLIKLATVFYNSQAIYCAKDPH
jgi:hypothetical protein